MRLRVPAAHEGRDRGVMEQRHDPLGDGTHVLEAATAGPAALRGSALRVVGYGAGLLLALISAPLLLRYLGQVEFGRYFTVMSIIAIVSGLTEGGLNVIATREYSTKSGAERSAALSNLLGMRISLGVVGGMIAVGFAAVAGYGEVLVLGTALASIGMVLHLIQSTVVVPLHSTLRFGWATAIDLIRQAVSVILIVTLVLTGAALLPFFAIAIPAGLIGLAITALIVRRLMSLRPSFAMSNWIPLLRDTMVLGLAIAVSTLYFRLTVILMSFLATPLETGYFSTSFQVIAVLMALPAITIASAFPILTRAAAGNVERLRAASSRILELAIFAGAWAMVSLQVGSEWIVRLLGGAAAIPAAPVLRMQAVAVLAAFVTFACATTLMSAGRIRAVLIINLLGLALSMGLALVLIPRFAAMGAAVAAVVAEGFLAFACIAALWVTADRVRPGTGVLVAVAAAVAVAGATGWLLRDHLVVATIVSSSAYLAVLAVSRQLPPEIRHVFDVRAFLATRGGGSA